MATTLEQLIPIKPKPRTGWDVERIRKDFPVLRQTVNGKPLVYLDNAASSQVPVMVIERGAQYIEQEHSNIHRGVHYLSMKATTAYEGAREKIKRFINARKSRECIFVRGATEGINLVMYAYGRKVVGAGDEIIISAMEHHSNIVPWQMLCEEKNAKLRVIPMNDAGELLLDEYDALLNDRTKLVAVTHVSNALGTINPIKEIVERAHKYGVPVLVDGAQAAPHMPVDVHDLDCDFYGLSAIEGVRIIGTAREKLGVLSFVLDDIHPHDIGTILDQEGIAIRAGHHCAQPVMQRFKVPATARASFAFYNTKEEIDALARAIEQVIEVFS